MISYASCRQKRAPNRSLSKLTKRRAACLCYIVIKSDPSWGIYASSFHEKHAMMMMSISLFGPVGCGLPLRGGETSKTHNQLHTTHHRGLKNGWRFRVFSVPGVVTDFSPNPLLLLRSRYQWSAIGSHSLLTLYVRGSYDNMYSQIVLLNPW